MPVIAQNSSVQFSSVAQSCPTLCDPMSRSTPIVTTSLMQTPGWVLDMQFVQSLSHVQLFVTWWTAACQASLSFTISCGLLKLMSIKSVMPSHLCRPLLLLPSIFPSISVLSSDLALRIKWPKFGGSASASVLLMNIQGWVPLGLTGWISLQSKGPSGVFSSTTVWKHLFFGAQPSSCCSWDSQGKNAEVVCHSLLHWITFCQHATPGLTLTTLLGGRFCSESCFPRWGNWS